MAKIFAPGSTLVLRNPASGRPGSRRRADALERELVLRGHTVTHTPGPRTAGQLARRFCEGRPDAALLVLGGDGTVFEALEALPPHVPLGVFPTGSVNLLARAHGVPSDPSRWLDSLEREHLRAHYFARCNGRPFTSVGSAGLDAEAVAHLDPRLKRALHEVAYALQALRLYPTHRIPRFRIAVDGREVATRVVGLLFGTVPYYGGPHRILPEAEPGKRGLEVALLGGSHRRAFWRYAAGLVTGALPRQRGVEYRRATRLAIEADPPIAVQLDGEPFGTTPVDVEVEREPRRVLGA